MTGSGTGVGATLASYDMTILENMIGDKPWVKTTSRSTAVLVTFTKPVAITTKQVTIAIKKTATNPTSTYYWWYRCALWAVRLHWLDGRDSWLPTFARCSILVDIAHSGD